MPVRRITKTTKGTITTVVDPPEPLLSPVEGARALNVSIHTLRQWLSQRRIPFYKCGRLTRLKREDLERFIAETRREAVKID